MADWYEEDKTRLQFRLDTLHDIEHGGNEAAEIGAFIADRIVRCHLVTMARMNVDYDLLAWEGDILRLHFWARAFEILKEKGAVFLQTQGRLAGCWVMPIEDGQAAPRSRRVTRRARRTRAARRSSSAPTAPSPTSARTWRTSSGSSACSARTSTTGSSARARPGHPVWATCDVGRRAVGHPPFGGAGAVFNVIDVRQSYLQKLLKQALAAIGHPSEAERSVHFSYEMVALTHNTARQLGYTLSAEDAGQAVRGGVRAEGPGREGGRPAGHPGQEGQRRGGRSGMPTCRRTTSGRPRKPIAVAAVRYFMVRFSRGKVIAFDIDEALNFEGESGPYLQYAVVRANNIFQKLRDREGVGEAEFLSPLGGTPTDELDGTAYGHDLWALVLESSRLDEVAEQAVRTLEFSVLAKYAFGLAQMFSAFYHRYPDPERRPRRTPGAGGRRRSATSGAS